MANQNELDQIELSIEEAREIISKKDAILRLSANRDFRQVIEQGYFEREASRLVLLKADPSMQEDREQKMINLAIDAIGHFRQYLRTAVQLGYRAETDLQAHQETREEILAEDVNA